MLSKTFECKYIHVYNQIIMIQKKFSIVKYQEKIYDWFALDAQTTNFFFKFVRIFQSIYNKLDLL